MEGRLVMSDQSGGADRLRGGLLEKSMTQPVFSFDFSIALAAMGHVLCPMPWQAAVDIDDVQDLHMAEALAEIAARGFGAET